MKDCYDLQSKQKSLLLTYAKIDKIVCYGHRVYVYKSEDNQKKYLIRTVFFQLINIEDNVWWFGRSWVYILEIHRPNGLLFHDSIWLTSSYDCGTVLFPEGNAAFQDDKVQIHTNKELSEWHEEHFSDVEHLILPSQSPDQYYRKIIVHWSILYD